MLMWVPVGIAGLIAIYLAVQGVLCFQAVQKAQARLAEYKAETAQLSYGKMTYVDRGEGEVILSVHGIFGGYDQAYETCKDRVALNRVIAPSRFGYLGSEVRGDGTPSEQAEAFVELLDTLGIEKVYVLGTSAGGTVAIRFALDYPERTKGLLLYCSAPPPATKPDTFSEYQGPPPFLVHDFSMFAIRPLFPFVMGLPSSTIYGMLPIDQKSVGVSIDSKITNPDMARNFEAYPIESLRVPTLILHAKDDQVVSFADMERAVPRFPDCTFLAFESGGHLMEGNEEAIELALRVFLQ